MRILVAFNQDLNPYVDVLINGLNASGCSVETGTNKFWDEDLFDYDIVHIQWPETLFDWRVPSAIELLFLRQRLCKIHQRAKIVYTQHNAVSHHVNETNTAILEELYSLIEEECDAMVHLGEASRIACATNPKLIGKRHVMIPIPIYDELYAPYLGLSPVEARKRLGLPQNRKIVLAFGNFRFEKEKQLVAAAMAGLDTSKVCLVAPKWHKARDYSFAPEHPMLALRSARKALQAWRRGWVLGAKKIMNHEEVALCFTAADVVLIQRLDELNSGNVPMGFLFRRAMTGPNCVNIGNWLQTTGNPVFDPADRNSARLALTEALVLAEAGKGEENYRFALTRWTTRKVGEATARFYESLVHE